MGSKAKAKWKQKMMKDKGLPLPSKKNRGIERNQQVPASVRKIDRLLKEAEEFIETFDYESAGECCQKALLFDSTNVKALEMLANVSLDLKDPETAYNMLLEAVKLAPKVGHRKYFSLGQLSEGQDALRRYEEGIEVATRATEQENNEAVATSESASSIQREISNAYCAMAELYMTDLCFEDDAQSRCEEMINKAIETDPSNPEAFQCRADFQLTTDQLVEAKEAMSESLALWLPKHQALREGRLETTDPYQECPLSYDSRINASKLLIELEMFDEVGDILDGLIDEDDEVVDTWYLLGWSNCLRGKDYQGNARFYLGKAKEVAQKFGEIDNEQFQHIKEMLQRLGSEPESEGEEEEENEEEDSESEGDEMEQDS